MGKLMIKLTQKSPEEEEIRSINLERNPKEEEDQERMINKEDRKDKKDKEKREGKESKEVTDLTDPQKENINKRIKMEINNNNKNYQNPPPRITKPLNQETSREKK